MGAAQLRRHLPGACRPTGGADPLIGERSLPRLRETLEASFRYGSHVAAAEYLQLHEHTVRNRLHKAEEFLGHTLSEPRTELQVAARLIRLLSGPEQT